eukprot:4556949-Amphidinium_carterae.1
MLLGLNAIILPELQLHSFGPMEQLHSHPCCGYQGVHGMQIQPNRGLECRIQTALTPIIYDP